MNKTFDEVFEEFKNKPVDVQILTMMLWLHTDNYYDDRKPWPDGADAYRKSPTWFKWSRDPAVVAAINDRELIVRLWEIKTKAVSQTK